MQKQSFILILMLTLCARTANAQRTPVPDTTAFPIEAKLYRDSYKTYKDANLDGLFIQFNGKFKDSSVQYFDANKSVDMLWMDNESKKDAKMVREHTWPYSGKYSQGEIVDTDDRSVGLHLYDVLRIEPGEQVKCYLIVRGTAKKKAPTKFPQVQINYTGPYDLEYEWSDGEKMNSFSPIQYQHQFRIDFQGGYIECNVKDLNPTRQWSVGDIVDAFGPELISFSSK